MEGKDFVISYQLVNTGNGVATGIELKDRYDPNRYVENIIVFQINVLIIFLCFPLIASKLLVMWMLKESSRTN